MASTVPDELDPDAEPTTVRAALTPSMAVMFDAEWCAALDEAKESKDLTGVRELLVKWRRLACSERRAPGSYFALLARAERLAQGS